MSTLTYFQAVPRDLLQLLLFYLPYLEVIQEFTVPEIPCLNYFFNDDKFWQTLYKRDIAEDLHIIVVENYDMPNVYKNKNIPKPPSPPPLPAPQSKWKCEYIKAMSILKYQSLSDKLHIAAINGWDKIIIKSLATWRNLITKYFDNKLSIIPDCILRDNDDCIADFTAKSVEEANGDLETCCDIELQFAAMNSHLHIVKLLVEEAHADPTVDDSAALVVATLCADKSMTVPIVSYLAEKGSYVRAGSSELFDLDDIENHIDIPFEDTDDISYEFDAPIKYSIERNDIELFKYLLDKTLTGLKDAVNHRGKSLEDIRNSELVARNGFIYRQLCYAIELHDRNKSKMHIITYLIDNGFDVNNIPLTLLVSKGDIDLMKYIMKKGYVNEKGKCSALIEAAECANFDIVKLLIKYNTNIDGQSSDVSKMDTPLSQACLEPTVDVYGDDSSSDEYDDSSDRFKCIIDYLILKGANVTLFNNLALNNATKIGNIRTMSLLLDHGADINDIADEILLNSLKSNKQEVFHYVLGKCRSMANARKPCIDLLPEVLLIAVRSGDNVLIDYCIENHVNLTNLPVVEIAARNNDSKVVQYLVEKGADININAPLKEAVRNKNVELVKYLIEKGANPNIVDIIETAIETEQFDLVKYLVEKGAYIHGDNLMEIAIAKKHLDIIEYLIEKGAHINSTCIKKAVETGQFDIVKYIVEQGADVTIEDHKVTRLAAGKGYLTILQYLVEKGADIHAHNEQALREACRYGHFEVVKYLVENKADVNKYNLSNVYNPLKSACGNNHFHIVKYLLEHGADAKLLNSKERKKSKIILNPETKQYEFQHQIPKKSSKNYKRKS